MYITPTNKDQEGKEFIFIVTGNGFTENKYGKGKMDKYKLHLLLFFVGMIIGQIIRWVI